MNAQAILTISTAVILLTQIVKWAGLPDRAGPIAVLLISALGVVVWAYSQNLSGFPRGELFDYVAGWITVSAGAAGVFGFTRAAASAVISAAPPPAGGAGSNPTT